MIHNTLACQLDAVLEEFDNAKTDLANSANPDDFAINKAFYQPIIAKYQPTLIGECEKAIIWSKSMVKGWLADGMLSFNDHPDIDPVKIIKEIGSHVLTKTHSIYISIQKGLSIGLKVVDLESDQNLQVESFVCTSLRLLQTLSATSAPIIIENHDGIAFIKVKQ